MKTIYTYISPITKAYTNFNHMFYLKKIGAKKVYLCVWDNFVFESDIFNKSLAERTNKAQKLQENVEALERLLHHLNIDYKIIYLSDAWTRLFRNSEFSQIFQKILTTLKVSDLMKGLAINYIPFGELTISQVNYIIADYLIALNLPELFPEICSTPPKYYLTSERFKIFQKNIINRFLPEISTL